MKPTKEQLAIGAITTISAFLVGSSLPPQDYTTDIVTEQASKEEYVQVLEGNRLPTDAKDSLSKRLPDNVSINTFDGPEGQGYSIVTREVDRTISIGVGAYAEQNTWVEDKKVISPTSTDKIKERI